MVLTLVNTVTRRKQPFEPMTPGVVRMFVCVPTVYDLSDVGHAKTYIQFDLHYALPAKAWSPCDLRPEHHGRRRRDHSSRRGASVSLSC